MGVAETRWAGVAVAALAEAARVAGQRVEPVGSVSPTEDGPC